MSRVPGIIEICDISVSFKHRPKEGLEKIKSIVAVEKYLIHLSWRHFTF